MTGYQEILSDPSYAGQIVCFTFPHIGIVGANDEDIEIADAACARRDRAGRRANIPSNYRALMTLDALAEAPQHSRHRRARHPRADRRIREKGMPHGVIAHAQDGKFDVRR